jgi:hypothetical protein
MEALKKVYVGSELLKSNKWKECQDESKPGIGSAEPDAGLAGSNFPTR